MVPKAHILLGVPSSWAARLLRTREERGIRGRLQVACAKDSLPDLASLNNWAFAFLVWICIFEDNIKEVCKFAVPVIMLESYISFPWQESSSEAQLAPSAKPLRSIIAGRSGAAIPSVAMATALGQSISLSLAQLLCPDTMLSAT